MMLLSVLIILWSCLSIFGTETVTISNETCIYDASLEITGRFSRAERHLRHAFLSVLGRLPSMDERKSFYNMFKTDEMDLSSFTSIYRGGMNTISNWSVHHDWNKFQTNKIYAWALDLHPSPPACNINVYRDIGVILHAEVDHHPFCEYYGICATRLQVFGIGKFASGFSLDPDHAKLKLDFFNHYQNSAEFNRIDVFICSHPAANCELFEHFLPLQPHKSMIAFFTTRFEFGRNDMGIDWRRRTVGKWNAWAELAPRQREWTQFVVNYHQQGRLFLAANSMYDVEYVEYFTGIRPRYIPSWCGDLDGSFNLQNTWIGCSIDSYSDSTSDRSIEGQAVKVNNLHYIPKYDEILLVPYKQRLWAHGGGADNTDHLLYKQLQTALINFALNISQSECTVDGLTLNTVKCPNLKKALTGSVKKIAIQHGAHAFRNHHAMAYKAYAAMLFIPYQTSVMTFFEMYRQNIPIFAPSLDLLVEWDVTLQVVNGRVYGWPDRYEDIIVNATGRPMNTSIPSPNLKYNDANYRQSVQYWLQFSDIYVFPHVIIFHSFEELVHLIATTDLGKVSEAMYHENYKQRIAIMRTWDELFKAAAPHRKRGRFDDKNSFVFNPHS